MTEPTTRYRKKPIAVEARQLTAESFGEIVRALTEDQFASGGENSNGTVFLDVRTLEGAVHASEGDWIIWGNHGDVWPVRGDIFAETYEPASAPAVVPPADRAALRDRIVKALYDSRRNGLGGMTEADAVAHMAEAVLAVLPEPTDRAAVLREAAAVADRIADEARKKRFAKGQGKGSTVLGARLVGVKLRELAHDERRMADETQPATPDAVATGTAGVVAPAPTSLRARVLREIIGRITGTGTADSATDEVGAPWVLAVLEDLLAETEAAVEARQDGAQTEADNPRTVCVCGHTRGEHARVSGRLLCDACDPDSTDNLVCKEFEAL